MADETTKTPDEQLLEDILNELDMTLADESMQKKIKDIMQRGKARIEKIGGKQLEFVHAGFIQRKFQTADRNVRSVRCGSTLR